jgi:AraC-like DNA-binding protein
MDERVTRIDEHDDGVNAWAMRRLAPPAGLAGLIDGYTFYQERTGGFTTRRELPHGDAVMIVNLGQPITLVGANGAVIRLRAGEGFVAGAHLRAALSQSEGAQAGVHIHLSLPALRQLLGVPLTQIVDQVVRLEDVLGAGAAARLGRLAELPAAHQVAWLDAALLERLGQARPLDRQQRHAVRLLRTREDLDIADIARDIGWSPKHLATRTRDCLGVGPRCFRRLLRFGRLMELLGRGPFPGWAAVALEAGYYDQPHMNREFREFAGLTPTAFLARSLPDGGGLVEP